MIELYKKVTFACIVMPLALFAEWKQPQKAVVLFAPGIFSNERQIVKYCQSYTTRDGKEYFCNNDFKVIQEPYYAINFPEIVSEQQTYDAPSLFGLFYNYVTNNVWHARSKSNDAREGIETTDVNPITWIDVYNVNFGQEADIAAVSQAYDVLVKQYPDHKIILYGVSRGAAAIMSFLGTAYNDKPHYLQRIAGVVCEGCYDSMENLLARFKYPSIARYVVKFLFPGYRFDGISPIKVAHAVPKHLPIIFITSKADNLVPDACVTNLVNALENSGHENIELVTLTHSPHPRYMLEHTDDRSLYQKRIHQFYKKHLLPYDKRQL
jgi:hypothetical protein